MIGSIQAAYSSVNERVESCVDSVAERLIGCFSKNELVIEKNKIEVKIITLWFAQTAFFTLIFGNPWLGHKVGSIFSASIILLAVPSFYQSIKKYLVTCFSELSSIQKLVGVFYTACAVSFVAAKILSKDYSLIQGFLYSNMWMGLLLLLSGKTLYDNREEIQATEQEKQELNALREDTILLESMSNKIDQFVERYPDLKEKIIQEIRAHPEWIAQVPPKPQGYEKFQTDERLVLSIKRNTLELVLGEKLKLIRRNNDIFQCFKECMAKDPEFATARDKIPLLSF